MFQIVRYFRPAAVFFLQIFYISDQLMFIPPGVPENQEDPATPLKKILLYNGASSWGG
jgi:hypothetical protein